MTAVAPITLSPDHLWQRARQVSYQPIVMHQWEKAGIEVLMRRDDQIDPAMSGNKFYKLYYQLLAARDRGIKTLVSFGGPHSNHLFALAASGRQFGFQTRGIIRGEAPKVFSPTLQDLQAMGMQLEFISRRRYREISQQRHEDRPEETLVIPEGGDNALGQKGAAIIARATEDSLSGNFTALCVAVGTGSTLAGIASGLTGPRYVLGVSTLKQGNTSSPLARRLLPQTRWRLLWGFHDGGYGRQPGPRALAFWREFEQRNGIAIEPVYTLKLLRAIASLAQLNYWPRGARIIAVHTGGIQGRRSYAPLMQAGD